MSGKPTAAGVLADPLKETWDHYLLLRRKLDQHKRDEPQQAALSGELTEVRNRLIDAYLPLLKSCAIRLKGRLPNSVELEDLCSAGVFGLMDAIERYDPARGVLFTTFAPLRISGAMLDDLRSTDLVPRLVRDRARKLERAVSKHKKEHGRPPTQDELAGLLNVPLKEVRRILEDGEVASHVSLDQPLNCRSQDRASGIADVLGDTTAVSPIDAAHKQSLKALFCKMLDRHERLIVVLYYYEGMTMKEIGQTLGISESRVSQRHAQIKERLRAQLSGCDTDLLVVKI
jgi:RNA polymerase sigma factor for flagellar operon FliA